MPADFVMIDEGELRDALAGVTRCADCQGRAGVHVDLGTGEWSAVALHDVPYRHGFHGTEVPAWRPNEPDADVRCGRCGKRTTALLGGKADNPHVIAHCANCDPPIEETLL